jgi:hypothetical protein
VPFRVSRPNVTLLVLHTDILVQNTKRQSLIRRASINQIGGHKSIRKDRTETFVVLIGYGISGAKELLAINDTRQDPGGSNLHKSHVTLSTLLELRRPLVRWKADM